MVTGPRIPAWSFGGTGTIEQPLPVTVKPAAPGRYLVFIEGIAASVPNWWTFDGAEWDHEFVIINGWPGMPGRRIFWVQSSRQEIFT